MKNNIIEYERIKRQAVRDFNRAMNESNINLKYVPVKSNNNVEIKYELKTINKFINSKYMPIPNLTKISVDYIISFMKSRNVKFQFVNNVYSII